MKSETPARPRSTKTPKRRETLLRGIAVSPGIAIGPAFDTSEAPAEAPGNPAARHSGFARHRNWPCLRYQRSPGRGAAPAHHD